MAKAMKVEQTIIFFALMSSATIYFIEVAGRKSRRTSCHPSYATIPTKQCVIYFLSDKRLRPYYLHYLDQYGKSI